MGTGVGRGSPPFFMYYCLPRAACEELRKKVAPYEPAVRAYGRSTTGEAITAAVSYLPAARRSLPTRLNGLLESSIMWIMLALLAALGSAGTSLVLKRVVAHGGIVVSTVAFRAVAGVLLLGVVAVSGAVPHLSAHYWRTAALVMVPEVGGMILMALALSRGELSVVQPLMGLLPLFVMLGGAVFLGEVPSAGAVFGIVLVGAGVYATGMERGGSLWQPLRALVYAPAGRYAAGAAFCWSFTAVLHRVGVAAVGAFPWAVTLCIGSALVLGLSIPLMARIRPVILPERGGPWGKLVVLCGVLFAVQQTGLQLALSLAYASLVIAVTSVSIFLGTLLGVLVLRERTSLGQRLAGGLFVSVGAALVAFFG